MYKNYIFDLYGTLIDINTDESYDDLWEEMANFYAINNAEYTPLELKEAYHRICKIEEARLIKRHKEIKHHEIDIHNVFKRLYGDKNVKVSTQSVTATAQYFRILSTKYIKLYDGAIHKSKFILKDNYITLPETDLIIEDEESAMSFQSKIIDAYHFFSIYLI